jgi:leucyl aminopeptidase
VTVSDDDEASWAGADLLAVPVRGGTPPVPEPSAVRAAQRYGVDLPQVLAAEKVAGRAGEVVRVPVQPPPGAPGRLLLVGIGDASPTELRRAGAALARSARGRTRVATSLAAGADDDGVRAAVEGLLLGGYAPPATGTKKRADTAPVAGIVLLGEYPDSAVTAGRVHAAATLLVRDLTATPSSTKNPQWVADRAAELAVPAGLRIDVWDEQRLAADGFGGLLAVGGGSATPPRFVRLDYRPDGARGRAARAGGRIVLIGKGITFDTGGLSIKPREAMVPMKTDMAGAAVVLAVLAACRELGVRRPVTGLLALAENAVGASSYRPSDVVRHYGGRTVEVTNTDAEGRMVLADALAYADARLDPDVVIDLATLTGAATLGLGRRHAALFSTDDTLAEALAVTARAGGENVWRMPLVEDYRPTLDSTVADLRHVAADARVGGGAVVAALFLREFAGRRRWAHLDIAGVARSDKDENEVSRGATGYGARLLLRWLESQS